MVRMGTDEQRGRSYSGKIGPQIQAGQHLAARCVALGIGAGQQALQKLDELRIVRSEFGSDPGADDSASDRVNPTIAAFVAE